MLSFFFCIHFTVNRPGGVGQVSSSTLPPSVVNTLQAPGVVNTLQAPGLPGSLFGPPPSLPGIPYPAAGVMQHPAPMQLQPRAPQLYVDPSGNIVHPSPYTMQHPPPPVMYPGVHSSYPTPQHPQSLHYSPPAAPMGYVGVFKLEGVLEFGILTTVHFRDQTTNFNSLPEFLRRELHKTYGKYPVTDIKIIGQGGEYHIYATPREAANEGATFDADNRMIQGFNAVR